MLNKVTLTGADDETKVEDLAALSREFPFVEWAVLFSYDRMGTERYPSLKWIEEFTDIYAKKAIHFCGLSAQRYILGSPVVNELSLHFQRVQLNFNLKRLSPDQDWVTLIQRKVDHNTLNWQKNYPKIILQHNENNAALHQHFEDTDTLWSSLPEFLFDASGGNGLQPTAWPNLFYQVYCGRAGGLGPDNVVQELEAMLSIDNDGRQSHRPFYIDMESKLRSERIEDSTTFDLTKVRQVLEKVQPYINV